jgi:uridylate kinase
MPSARKKPGRKTAGLKYRRVLIKVSGESFAGPGVAGLEERHIDQLAEQLAAAARLGAQLAVVVGGGNFIRGANLAQSKLIRPVAAHQMGMMATVINGSALAEALRAKGCPAVLTCSMPAGNFTELYNPQRCQEALSAGKIVVLTGGTGNSFVTTDTCAAVRAAELQADVLLKATKVDGVYSADPAKIAEAKRFERLSYDQVIDQRLAVMDLSAVTICRESKIPIIVFSFQTPGSIVGVLTGKVRGTTIGN